MSNQKYQTKITRTIAEIVRRSGEFKPKALNQPAQALEGEQSLNFNLSFE